MSTHARSPASAADVTLRHELTRGTLSDERFDDIYPDEARGVSLRFWTPLAVSARCAHLFAEHAAARILDVGSGVGKFCIGAAAVREDLAFTGIEHRPHLVDIARRAAVRFDARNVRFLLGDATFASWNDFDGLYFFNPFGENVFVEEDCYDATVELSEHKFVSSLLRTARALSTARVGAVLVTYQGLGGPIPRCFELAHAEKMERGWLRAWVKRRQTDDGGHWIEIEGGKIARARIRTSGSLEMIRGRETLRLHRRWRK